MLQPDIHLDVVRERHSDLLREAREGQLALRVRDARRDERRSFLARLRAKPDQGRPSTAVESH
jgi:hypothetical protein